MAGGESPCRLMPRKRELVQAGIRNMTDDRERFTKVLALAMHPETIATEALAAFHRARELAKASPSLAHPPSERAPALRQPCQGRVYRARITSVRQDRVLLLLELLSKRAYELDLKY